MNEPLEPTSPKVGITQALPDVLRGFLRHITNLARLAMVEGAADFSRSARTLFILGAAALVAALGIVCLIFAGILALGSIWDQNYAAASAVVGGALLLSAILAFFWALERLRGWEFFRQTRIEITKDLP